MEFSVLMSVYDKEKPEFFDLALESIIKQTLMPNEIVLVEDGPINKGLEAVINKYKEKYGELIKSVVLPENQGLGIALNEGLKHCKNELVARMDTDDISKENRFEEQIKRFTEDSELTMVGGSIAEFDKISEDAKSLRVLPETHDKIIPFLKKRNAFNHATVMYKKSKVLAAGGYLDCPYFEDYYLWTRMAMDKTNKFYNIQSVLLYVRIGNNMLDRRGGKNYVRSIKNFLTKIYESGFINKREYVYNLLIRSFVAMIPNKARGIFYKSFLRKNI